MQYIVISTAQTDIGLISRTFSLKINKLPTFSEISQGWQCLKIVFIWSDELMNLNFTLDPTILNIKTCTAITLNHSIMTT